MPASFRKLFLLSLCCAFVFVTKANATAEKMTRLLHSPTVSESHVAFMYASDLWVANIDGSNPKRLTVHEGMESLPYFSEDGKWIAFTGQYDGNRDVYVVSVEGGAPKRLTYHPGADNVTGWHGEKVLFTSTRTSDTYRYAKLFAIGLDSGFPEEFELPRAWHASFSDDGNSIAYTSLPDAYRTWKRYRGGLAPFIWVFDRTTKGVVEIPRYEENNTYANDSWPEYVGGTVYFLSDRNFIMNVFAYNTATKEVRQVTSYDDYDVKNLRSNGNRLVFEQAGLIHTFTVQNETPIVLNIAINPDLPDTRPHFENVGNYISSFSVSPKGVRGLFAARGDIYTVPKESGDIRNLTNSSDSHERFPAWSPKGDKIAYFSDNSGEYKLNIVDQKGIEKSVVISLAKKNFFYGITWSPDGEKILYIDRGLNLYMLDVDKKKSALIATDKESSFVFDAKWSSDSRWITFCKTEKNYYHSVHVYDTKTKKTHRITDGMSDTKSPVFSKDGKYLFFASSTNYGLNMSGLEMSGYDEPLDYGLYMFVLSKEESTPFAPESDEEEVSVEEEEEKEDDKKDEESDDNAVIIDFEGLSDRILSLPVENGSIWSIQVDADGNVFYVMYSDDSVSLQKYDFEEEESSEFLANAYGYEISADGKNIIYEGKGGVYGIVETSGSPDLGDGKLATESMEMYVYPRKEWKQMYNEAWRLERDFFYDENMHGADWNAVKKKYALFLPHIGHRSELNWILGEMIGELVVGHAYRGGGDYPDVDYVPVGMLGADFVIDKGRYRFNKVFSGLNWISKLRAPLREPGIDIVEGEYLLAINGIELKSEMNVYEFLQNTAGKQTTLTINSKPSMKDAREVVIEPLRSDGSLRMLNWIEENRKKVDEATNGRVGYVYLPDTASDGYYFFNRYYFSQIDKEGLIVDERYNGGGKVADYMIDLMSRPLINWWATRDMAVYSTPQASHFGPKILITNQFAGSGGDWLPMAFKRRGVGKVVGKRTWGGLVGIGGTPALIDGGYVTTPGFGVFSPEGDWEIENYGVDPDIEVEQTPKEIIEGKDPQLDRAIQEIMKEINATTPQEGKPKPHPRRAAKK